MQSYDKVRLLLVKSGCNDNDYLELCGFVERQRKLFETVEKIANCGSVNDYTVAGIRCELRDALVEL